MTREELRAVIAAAIKDATSIGGAPNHPCVIGHFSAANAALSAIEAAGVRLVPVEGWQPIETAPKGNGDQFESVTDPGYIAPPEILMLFEDGNQCVVRWDWYYAPDGYGHAHAQGGPAWVAVAGGELAHLHFGNPTHWRPLPTPPVTQHEDTP